MKIQSRILIEVNTDPQRRCYDGVHAKSELRWTEWIDLCDTTPEDAQRQIKFWSDLNDYAVSQRGEINTKREFRAV